MLPILFLTWQCLTFTWNLRINQDRWCGCLQLSAVYCLHWVFLTPCLFTLSSLISVCVVVFSLPPSFTCLLLPFTCTPATSSVVSIHTARRSGVSSRQCVACEPCVFLSVISISSRFFVNFAGASPSVKPHSVTCDAVFVWLNTKWHITQKICILQLVCIFMCWRRDSQFTELLHDLWR